MNEASLPFPAASIKKVFFLPFLSLDVFFRPGSVIAEFQLTFKTKVTGEEALAPLKRETAGGKLGSLEVDPNSLKPKSAKQGVLYEISQ